MNGALTVRRHQVLSLAASGLTDKEIAVSLRITVRTVRFHFTESCRVLGARTRLQATAIAAARGLVDPLVALQDLEIFVEGGDMIGTRLSGGVPSARLGITRRAALRSQRSGTA